MRDFDIRWRSAATNRPGLAAPRPGWRADPNLMAFDSLSLPLLGFVFLAGAVATWLGGWRLAHYVDAVTTRTGAGQALMGMLLLGGVSSLPEVAAVSTAASIGNAPLAVNNLLGTASINILILAVADIVYGREALTVRAARPATLMQGVLAMLLASVVAMVATAGDIPIFGFGLGSASLAAGAVAALWISSGFEHRHTWEVVGGQDNAEDGDREGDPRPLWLLILLIMLCAALILVAGFVLSSSADALAEKTGISAGMIGFILVGLATSLPEISSTIAAVKLRRYQMAIGDIFGTNIFNIMLIFLADLIYPGAPVLGQAGTFEAIGAILTVMMTGMVVVGLLERKDKAILRMGYDSVASLATFAIGLWLLSRTMN
ncbi:sodium:calcium antiporter [Sphingosinicella rhizophila]|uniref:Sodium:calcium antiporter n=1 Tax=Sphingosinicella rhizophila TaxID=3050082 RepID=A0ABU3Q698_9SPHN|nr:sodium:calcium antiporter [Sphingosinicella sp. GR2756]MDT9598929.1 sodium:calcium antiporter [Sphingosinicella sp. GR2756]